MLSSERNVEYANKKCNQKLEIKKNETSMEWECQAQGYHSTSGSNLQVFVTKYPNRFLYAISILKHY